MWHSRLGLRIAEQRTRGGGLQYAGKMKGKSYHRDSPTSLHNAHLPLGREIIFTGLREGLPDQTILLRVAYWPAEGVGMVPREGSDQGPGWWPSSPGLAETQQYAKAGGVPHAGGVLGASPSTLCSTGGRRVGQRQIGESPWSCPKARKEALSCMAGMSAALLRAPRGASPALHCYRDPHGAGCLPALGPAAFPGHLLVHPPGLCK